MKIGVFLEKFLRLGAVGAALVAFGKILCGLLRLRWSGKFLLSMTLMRFDLGG